MKYPEGKFPTKTSKQMLQKLWDHMYKAFPKDTYMQLLEKFENAAKGREIKKIFYFWERSEIFGVIVIDDKETQHCWPTEANKAGKAPPRG